VRTGMLLAEMLSIESTVKKPIVRLGAA
jgi:hypothetical protein